MPRGKTIPGHLYLQRTHKLLKGLRGTHKLRNDRYQFKLLQGSSTDRLTLNRDISSIVPTVFCVLLPHFMPPQAIKLSLSLSTWPPTFIFISFTFKVTGKPCHTWRRFGAALHLATCQPPRVPGFDTRHLNRGARFSAPPAAGFFRLIRVKSKRGPRTASAEGVGKARARPDANWASSRRCHLATSSAERGQGRRVRGTTAETNLRARDYFCG